MPADDERRIDLGEIARLLESHEGPPDPRRRPAPARGGLLRTGAVATGALVVGSGVGFVLASSFSSTETAQASFSGTGFVPARGWTVMQSGQVDEHGVSRAIAANVPLRSADVARPVPRASLASLPERDIVVVASFTTRGDAEADAAFPARTLPLDLSSATRPRPGELRIRAGVRGTNVDLRVYFGSSAPSPDLLAAARRQLSRLVVGSERVTIFARPTVAGPTGQPFPFWVRLFGSVESGRAGESVEIQAKDCGSDFFRLVTGATTEPGGGWSVGYAPGINTTLRAVWGDASSAQISIRAHVQVSLAKRRDGKTLWVAAWGKRSFWRKQVVIQRRAGGRWTRLRAVLLTEGSNPDSGPATGHGGSFAEFVPRVPKGTLLRAVLPPSEAKPCYLAGTSRPLRT